MSWFHSNKEEKKPEKKNSQSTKEKVEENIYACKRNKNKLLDRRDELKRRINSTINTSYFVPSAWWYTESKYFEEIKALANNQLLSEEIKNTCDDLVRKYNDELQIIEVQIEHYDFLLQSYIKSLDELYNTKDEFRSLMLDLQKMRALESANSALSKMKDDGNTLLAKELFHEEKFKDIKLEIETLGKDLDLFEEYINQLKLIKNS